MGQNSLRLESCAHQGGFVSLLLRALRAFRLWRLYRNSDATVAPVPQQWRNSGGCYILLGMRV
jgi:hypothetical protein